MLTFVILFQFYGCTLHLLQDFIFGPRYRVAPILSNENAIGLVMGSGVLGYTLKQETTPSVFLSSDAGYSWREVSCRLFLLPTISIYIACWFPCSPQGLIQNDQVYTVLPIYCTCVCIHIADPVLFLYFAKLTSLRMASCIFQNTDGNTICILLKTHSLMTTHFIVGLDQFIKYIKPYRSGINASILTEAQVSSSH